MSDFSEFWGMYPRKVGRGAAQKKFDKALSRDSLKNIMTGLAVMVESSKTIEKRFIPHAATWLHQDRWLDELDNEEKIADPHPDLDDQCAVINSLFAKSQRVKGNWSKIDEITDGKGVVDSWLKSTNISGWNRYLIINSIMSAMKAGTVVTSFTHWEGRLK